MAITQGNLGIVKNNLQLYYNRESVKSFRGQATTNLLTYTSDFSNGVWVGYCGPKTNITYNTTDLLDPIGTNTAVKIARNNQNGCGGVGDVAMGLLYSSSTILSSGGTYTVSFYARGASGGESLTYGLNDSHVVGTTLTTKWTRYTTTFTNISGTDRGIQFYNSLATSQIFYIWGPQVENKAYATPYIASTGTQGTRSANTYAGGGGLIDLSGNGYTADLNSAAVAFDSGGFYFNGDAAGALTTPVANSTLDSLSNNTHTYEVWFKLLGTPPGTYDGYFFGRQGFHEGFAHYKSTPGTIFTITWYNDNTATGLGYTASLNTWYYGAYVVNVETATRKLYVNGSLVDSNTLTKQLKQYASTTVYYVGSANPSYSSNCIVSVARAHNRELTAAEITRNFESQRKVYGI